MDDVHCLDLDAQDPMRDENINISDVIEVIETDPDFQASAASTNMYPPQQPPQTQTQTTQLDTAQVRRQAVVHIVEQPASKALRFRYECEGRSAGSIPGATSTSENKSFPSIRIVGYHGKSVVVVSCVTKDSPYRPHPHNLVGREGCRKGVCTLEISPESMSITFSNLGIQCVKKKDIESALKVREEIRVDPFKTGFSHRSQPTSIDLNAVRLCFQVFIEGDRPNKFTVPLAPIVSDPIYDKKAMSDLVIIKLSDCVSTVDGGRKDLILLCEKVAKEDIQVRFYEEKDGNLVWEGFGDFQPSQVHKQTAIWFKTPRYRTLDITEPVKVNIQLRRPSDGATSEPLPFELLPLDSGVKRKRKFEHDAGGNLLRPDPDINRDPNNQFMMNRIPVDIKAEPQDPRLSPMFNPGGLSPYNNQGGLSPYHQGTSPIYAPNPSISPHNYMPTMEATPSPDNHPYNITYTPNNNLNPIIHNPNNLLPSINNVLTNPWNIQSTPNIPQQNIASNAMTIDTHNGLSITDLDSNQMMEMKINSSDLANYYIDPNNLSENLSNNLSLTDNPKNDQNMTDSLTRLAQTTYDNMYAPN